MSELTAARFDAKTKAGHMSGLIQQAWATSDIDIIGDDLPALADLAVGALIATGHLSSERREPFAEGGPWVGRGPKEPG